MDIIALSLIAYYSLIIFIPIYNQVVIRDQLFGNDVAEYLLTAHALIESKQYMFEYPYPLLPLVYILPSYFIKDYLILYKFGSFVSGFLMILAVYSMYSLLKSIIIDDIARIISILFFMLFPLTLDIIGWGGQSTLLAVFLGILSLAFIIRYFIYSKRKFFILSGLITVLSTLSDPFISMYFICAQGILILLKFKQEGLVVFIKKASFLIPAILVLTFFIVNDSNIHNKVIFSLLIFYIPMNFDILYNLVLRLTVNYFGLYLTIVALILTYFVLNRIMKMKNSNNRFHLLLPTSLAFLIEFSITPSQYADRALFFSSIPLSIMLGEIIENSEITNVKILIRYNRIRNRRFLTALLYFTLISVLLVPGFGFTYYYNSIAYYTVDKDFLSELHFINNQEGNVLFISPHPWVFSISYITGKDVYPTTQPVWFINEQQIYASILAYNLAWGVRWIDAGEIKVVDSTPVWAQPTPAIYVAKYPYYVELFRLSDGLLPVTFSPSNNESVITSNSPFYANEIRAWNSNNAMFSLYNFTALNIEKIIQVSTNGEIKIALNYNFTNSIPRDIKIRLISLMLMNMQAFITPVNDTNLIVKLLQSFKEPWVTYYYNTNIGVHSLNAKASAKFVEYDEWGLPEIMIDLKPVDSTKFISILLEVRIDNVNVSTPHIVVEEDVLKQNNIKWIIIDKSTHPDIIQRFKRDFFYEVYTDQTKLIIFKVKD